MNAARFHYGWVIVAASFSLIFLDGLLLYTFGVFKPYLSEAVRLSETQVASIFSLRCVILAVSMPIAGRLSERYDPRWVVVAGGVIASLGVFLSGYADTITELYLFFGVLVGLGDGAFYTLPVAIISRWFQKNRALAIGIATTGLPVSGFVLSPVSAWLIHSYGLKEAFFTIAAIVFTISLSGLLLRKDPDAPSSDEPAADLDAGSVRAVDALRRYDFWILYFVFWAGFNTFLIVIVNLYDFALDSGLGDLVTVNLGFVSIETVRAAIPPALIGVGSVFGRVFFSGFVLRFFSEKRVLLMCYLCQVFIIIPVLFLSGDWIFYLFGFLFGFFYSGWIPIFPMVLGNLYGLRELGAIFGFFGSGFSLAALTGPITAGLLQDSIGGYFPIFVAAAVFCATAAAMTFVVQTGGSRREAA